MRFLSRRAIVSITLNNFNALTLDAVIHVRNANRKAFCLCLLCHVTCFLVSCISDADEHQMSLMLCKIAANTVTFNIKTLISFSLSLNGKVDEV